MKRKKTEGLIIILCGLIIMGAGVFVFYIANTVHPNSTSSRVQDFNWLLNTFGKRGSALLFGLIGFFMVCLGIKVYKRK